MVRVLKDESHEKAGAEGGGRKRAGRPTARAAETSPAALSSSIVASARQLTPRRLMALTGAFVIAVGAIFFGKFQDDISARKTETRLIVEQAAGTCADIINLAVMTGDSLRQSMAQCHPGGVSAVYHLSSDGNILTAYGNTRELDLPLTISRGLALNKVSGGELSLDKGPARAAWRPLDNNEAILITAPTRDIFNRSPLWLTYFLLFAAISLVLACLMAAFLRQSRAAGEAANALNILSDTRSGLAHGRASIWQFHEKDRSVSLSRSLLESIGLGSRDRVFSLREITALVHPKDLRTTLAILTGETKGITEGTVRLRRPNGEWSRVYLRTSPDALRFSRNGVAIDLAGAETFEVTAALADARLKDAIEAIPEAFVLWDGNGRLVAWNRRFAAIFRLDLKGLEAGLTTDQVVELARVGGEIIEQYFAPASPIGEQSLEVELPRDHWLLISRRRTKEGGIVCVASNVTDNKRRSQAQLRKEQELKQLVFDLEHSRRDLSDTMQKYQVEKHKAEEASRSKSEFLANMSHELRTPLNAINGFSEILQLELYGPLGNDKYKEYVDDILSSGKHLLELIDDVLDMSKIETGRMALDRDRVELERVLQECGRLVAKRARDKGVTLTVSVAHAPSVWADARAIKQVVLNLLSNAVKFTPEGGTIALTVEADLEGATIIVADSGIGIERTDLMRLGAPFEQVGHQYAATQRGSGLGLALSKSLMDLMGGILAIASQPTKGTVACAALPRRPDAKVRLPQFVRKEAHVLADPETLTLQKMQSPESNPREAAE
ncbi:MAG: ATP-binding protein [Pseudomonadota bacterium]